MHRLILTSAAALALAGAGADLRPTSAPGAASSERAPVRNRCCPVTGRRASEDLPPVAIDHPAGGTVFIAVATPAAAAAIASAPRDLQALFIAAAARGAMVREGRIVASPSQAETDRFTRRAPPRA